MDEQQMRKAMEIAKARTINDPHLAEFRRQAEDMEAAGMSTDGPTPPPCNQNVFDHGEVVFQTSTIASNVMEMWVQQIAKQSGQLVDWHFSGGRANVLALGDIGKVKVVIAELMPEHDRLYQEALHKLGL